MFSYIFKIACFLESSWLARFAINNLDSKFFTREKLIQVQKIAVMRDDETLMKFFIETTKSQCAEGQKPHLVDSGFALGCFKLHSLEPNNAIKILLSELGNDSTEFAQVILSYIMSSASDALDRTYDLILKGDDMSPKYLNSICQKAYIFAEHLKNEDYAKFGAKLATLGANSSMLPFKAAADAYDMESFEIMYEAFKTTHDFTLEYKFKIDEAFLHCLKNHRPEFALKLLEMGYKPGAFWLDENSITQSTFAQILKLFQMCPSQTDVCMELMKKYYAVHNPVEPLMFQLKPTKVDMDFIDADGFPLIAYAVCANNPEVLDFVMEKGVDIFAINTKTLENAVQIALRFQCFEAYKHIKFLMQEAISKQFPEDITDSIYDATLILVDGQSQEVEAC